MLIRKLQKAELEDHLLDTLSEIEDARARMNIGAMKPTTPHF
jgi:hypothetical protein